MSRSVLLRLLADRLDGTAILPSAIDGLQAPHVPRLTFHDVLDDELAPWLERFEAEAANTKTLSLPKMPDFTVTTYRGALFGTTVEIVLFREAS